MPSCASAIDRLRRLVGGLLDADILLPEEGGALLEMIEAALQCHGDGDLRAARRHATQLGRAIEALVRSGAIEEAAGREALAASHKAFGDLSG
jgi:hypothetical protein